MQERDPTARFRLDGRVALITGGSRGIGHAIAQTFSAVGAEVFLCARDEARLREAAATIEATGGVVGIRTASVSDPEGAAAAVDGCMDRFGRVDVLVNNAGADAAMPLLDPDWETLDAMWQLNYFGAWRCTRDAWHRHMKDHGGVIVNISSKAAAHARPVMGAYGMSKAALCDLTRRLASEMGPTARVNAIAPGLVLTEMVRELIHVHGAPSGVGVDGQGSWPLRRGGSVQDVAAAALYLASDASAWVTGQVLFVDGGASLL